MGRNTYLGGSSLDGPGAAYFRPSAEDGNAPRKIDADIQNTMNEHDILRARGVSPIGHEKSQIKKAKMKRTKLKAEIKSLKKELELLRAKSNAT